MLLPGSYKHICRAPTDIPVNAYSRLRREIGENIGLEIGRLFPSFKHAFPETAAALEKYWPTPIIVCEPWRNDWLVALVLERQDLNLFFNVTNVSEPIDGPDFEQSHGMLPMAWRELYRWFGSFVITNESVKPTNWKNTPFPYSGRLSLEEYRQQIGAKKSSARAFAAQLETSEDWLRCWLWTDAGDALFLDEKKRDHRVYHIRNNDLADVLVLPYPDRSLDSYLAHIVSGAKPGEFDFRK